MTKIEIKLLNGDWVSWSDPDEIEDVEAVFEDLLTRKTFCMAFPEDGTTPMIPISSIAYVNITKED